MTTRRLLAIALPILSLLLVTTGVVIGRGLTAPLATTELDSTFTYQGNLTGISGPVTDTCDFQFDLFDALQDGAQIDDTLGKENIEVVNGLFSVQLDFGGGAFDGDDRFLEIDVRCPASEGIFTKLIPRQPLTPTPYAIYSFNAPWDGLTGVPEGFADGSDDDALSNLSCEHNQAVKWNTFAQAWQCAFPDDEVDSNQEFTASDTFIVPDGVKTLHVEVWGAGGGGGDHGSGLLAGGGGGGGGGGYTLRLIDVSPGEELTIVIGDGGEPGIDGGDTSVRLGETILAAATGGKTGHDAGDGTCSPIVSGAGGDPGEGGKGDTSSGNPGTMGGPGFRSGFPITNCFHGFPGPGGEAIEGSVAPTGSTGGSGGGGVGVPNGDVQVPPTPGGDGYVFIRW